jgi:DNA recombination protein RmuC
MEVVTAVLLGVLLLLVLLLIWDRFRQERRWREQSEAMSRAVREEVGGSIGVFGELQLRIGELAERARRIEDVGRSVSQLNETLRAPQTRGRFGEVGLETLLRNHFPYSYQTQHRFRNGKTVDAVLQVGDRLVPIDSKFPHSPEFEGIANTESDEERRRLRRQLAGSLKRHADAVREYIQPGEGTFDFALMYLPSEGLYYEAIARGEADGSESELCAYCREHRIFPVSPSTLHAYLQAIVLGLQGMQLERTAREMQQHLRRLQGDLEAFQGEYRTLGGHIRNSAQKYDAAERTLQRLEDKLRLAGSTAPEPLPEASSPEPEPE